MIEPQVQYISDEKGNVQSVIIPIELWRDLLSERETAYLLNSEAMKRRLLKAIQSRDGIPFEQDIEKLGI